jgi:hypothetical protein
LEQPIGRITQLRLYPIRPFWSLGSGWAAVAGGLAAGGFALTPEALLTLLLVWLLADPILGVLWDLGSGDNVTSSHTGIWRQLLAPQLPETARPLRFLPYLQPASPGYRLAEWLGRLRCWWQSTFQPYAGRDFAAIVSALSLALLLGVILGLDVLALVVASALLSWLAALSDKQAKDRDQDRLAADPASLAASWHALGEFGIPWVIGATVAGGLSWPIALLGACYTITYFGLIRPTGHFRLIAASQVTGSLLLAALRHPLAAGGTAIMLMPQWGLHVWCTYLDGRPDASHAGPRLAGYLNSRSAYLQPFIILSMVMAALAITS